MLKDSSPYNVQFVGARPVFVDVGSFEPLREGEPWAGYRQFCMLFLYPLMLHAWKDIPFQPRLRGAIDGITPRGGAEPPLPLARPLPPRRADGRRAAQPARAPLRGQHERREGRAQARRLQEGADRRERRPTRAPRVAASASAIGLDVVGLRLDDDLHGRGRRAQAPLRRRRGARRSRRGSSGTSGRTRGSTRATRPRSPSTSWRWTPTPWSSTGCIGELAEERSKRILPLVVNVVDPSPGLGWRGTERQPLPDRGRPDLTLCLAVLHHVSISGNVPVASFLDWLRDLGGATVIEFPTPEDPMVARLLARKREHDHPDYRRDWFEQQPRGALRRARVDRARRGNAVHLPCATPLGRGAHRHRTACISPSSRRWRSRSRCSTSWGRTRRSSRSAARPARRSCFSRSRSPSGCPRSLLLVELLVHAISPRLAYALHLVFVAALGGACSRCYVLTRTGALTDVAAIAVAAALGVLAAAAYRARTRPRASFLTVLAPVPVLLARAVPLQLAGLGSRASPTSRSRALLHP